MQTNNKLREALVKILAIAKDGCVDIFDSLRIENLCRQALAEPLRNCEVGTAEEQKKRLDAYCEERQCINCPHIRRSEDESGACGLGWAQMPYEEGVNDEQKQ